MQFSVPDKISSSSISLIVSDKLLLHTGHASMFIRDSRIDFPFEGYEIFIDLRISDKMIINIPVIVTNV